MPNKYILKQAPKTILKTALNHGALLLFLFEMLSHGSSSSVSKKECDRGSYAGVLTKQSMSRSPIFRALVLQTTSKNSLGIQVYPMPSLLAENAL